jgi:maltose alpha-D-glucosyltransferase/alpha-amylase
MFETDPLWYKDAIIYELHVKAFYDSNNDGIGDFAGLTLKLDYLQDLGVNTLWLLPFYPSPMRDDGYDISDYRKIHPDYGNMADFRSFVREAHRRGIKVITELVINHTSDQHPWFQAARQAPPGSAKRNYYIWSDDDKKFPETRIIFTDTESSNWAWDKVAQAYYWHRFFSHQPDLNHNNPHVVKAIMRIMRFWLDAGVDGLRLDAIPYLCVREGTNNENLPETHAVIRYMRAELDKHYTDRMFLAEANQWPEDVREYFGQGDECHMAYHFPLMPRIYMAVAQEDRHPVVEILRQTPDIPDNCQWAIFLRNHDELTLEMVTDRERDYMYNIYASDPRMRINVGIRRRLATLMDNDRAKIELMTWLLMTMPGSPILYYGDEIGMGDNIYLGDRNAVRTPMQWTPDRNAGFSRADPQRLYLPPVMDPVYGYEAINVEAQSRNASSLLSWTKRLIAIRKNHAAFSRGTLELLTPGNRKVLAYVRKHDNEAMLCVANLAHSPQPVELDLAAYRGRLPVELTGRTVFPPIGELPYLLTLKGYGFYTFRLTTDAEMPVWHEEHPVPAELLTIVAPEGWDTLLPHRATEQSVRKLIASRARAQLEHDVLPTFLRSQLWYVAKARALDRVELGAEAEWSTGQGTWLLSKVNVHFADGEAQSYFVPLAIAWGELEEERLHPLAPWTLAKIRQKSRVGILFDALGDDDFCRAVLHAMLEKQTYRVDHGEIRFMSTDALPLRARSITERISRPVLERNTTAVVFGDGLILRALRCLQTGGSVELEMGQFLTETSPFPHIAPIAGAVTYHNEQDDTVTTIGYAHGYIENQGTGWSYTVDYLERFFEGCLSSPSKAFEEGKLFHAPYFALMKTLGMRTGELHKALAKPSGDPAFGQDPILPEEPIQWAAAARREGEDTLALLERQMPQFSEDLQQRIKQVLESHFSVLDQTDPTLFQNVRAVKTRCHGDYHLGHVLLTQNDFVIIDFEGDLAHTIPERQAKHLPLRDVACMFFSFYRASAVSVERAVEGHPEAKTVLAPFASGWIAGSVDAFLKGYRQAISGCPSYPSDPHHVGALIALFTIERAFHDLREPLSEAPAELSIALEVLLELLGNPLDVSLTLKNSDED